VQNGKDVPASELALFLHCIEVYPVHSTVLQYNGRGTFVRERDFHLRHDDPALFAQDWYNGKVCSVIWLLQPDVSCTIVVVTRLGLCFGFDGGNEPT